MNKTELVDYIKENSQGVLTKKQAEQAVDLAFQGIIETLEKGGKVQLVGYLTLEPVGRKARKGRNPQTGAEIDIAPAMAVKSKAGKHLENAVKGLNVEDFLK